MALITRDAALALARGSAHLTSPGLILGRADQLTEDVSATEGSRTFTVGAAHGQILLVGRAAFITGNGPALADQLGLAPSVAALHAGRWISVDPAQGAYAALPGGMALGSLVHGIDPQTTLVSTGSSTVDGQAVHTESRDNSPATWDT